MATAYKKATLSVMILDIPTLLCSRPKSRAQTMATIVTHQPRPVPAFRRQHSACIAYRSSPIPNRSQSSSPILSSMDPTTPPMSTDIQHEHPFGISSATGSGMSFAELDLSQATSLNLGPFRGSKSKVESSPVSHPVFCAGTGSDAFYNPSPPFPPHSLDDSSVSPVFAQPSEVMLPSPPTFAPVPILRVSGSSSPPGLDGDSDEDLVSDSGESEAVDPSDAPECDDDDDFIPSHMSSTRTLSRRTSSMSSSSVRAARTNRLGAPVPVPNLTKKSRGRRVPTAPVFMVQGGVQKNMRMYKCSVEGCNKCFARGEHLKRHVRSIHTNEKPHKCPVEGFGKDTSRHDNLFTPVPIPRVRRRSSSPPGLAGDSDKDIVSVLRESEAADLSDAAEGDDDRDFIPPRLSLPRTRSSTRPRRLGAPIPVPNLTKKSRGRRVPTAPVFVIQGGLQKNLPSDG